MKMENQRGSSLSMSYEDQYIPYFPKPPHNKRKQIGDTLYRKKECYPMKLIKIGKSHKDSSNSL